MDIDFHHAVTYVVARAAGFSDAEARVVSHCAQYVDDATNEGNVRFSNGGTYRRIATAHRMLDYKNFAELAAHSVWIPFHFLPGNGGLGPDESPGESFIDKLITRPNSCVAKDMVRHAITDRERPHGLHRLGITAHVFVDTWAHQGFAGVSHRVNVVKDVRRRGHPDERFRRKMAKFFNGMLHQAVNPVGHGAALSYPDRPYLVWSYINGRGERIERDNPSEFLQAADELCRVFRRYRLGDANADVEGLDPNVAERMHSFFAGFDEGSGPRRHARWIRMVRDDAFGFGPIQLDYRDKGPGSWKYAALGTTEISDSKKDVFEFHPRFMKSDWKLFHDAAKAHRLAVVDEILPRYGILVA